MPRPAALDRVHQRPVTTPPVKPVPGPRLPPGRITRAAGPRLPYRRPAARPCAAVQFGVVGVDSAVTLGRVIAGLRPPAERVPAIPDRRRPASPAAPGRREQRRTVGLHPTTALAPDNPIGHDPWST
jgi:hypothetical protein